MTRKLSKIPNLELTKDKFVEILVEEQCIDVRRYNVGISLTLEETIKLRDWLNIALMSESISTAPVSDNIPF